MDDDVDAGETIEPISGTKGCGEIQGDERCLRERIGQIVEIPATPTTSWSPTNCSARIWGTMKPPDPSTMIRIRLAFVGALLKRSRPRLDPPGS